LSGNESEDLFERAAENYEFESDKLEEDRDQVSVSIDSEKYESVSPYLDFVQSVMLKQDAILLKFDSKHHPFCQSVLERTSLLADPTSCREIPNNIELNIIQFAKGIMDILQLKVHRLCAILVMDIKQQFLERKSTKVVSNVNSTPQVTTPALTLPKSIKTILTPMLRPMSSSNDSTPKLTTTPIFPNYASKSAPIDSPNILSGVPRLGQTPMSSATSTSKMRTALSTDSIISKSEEPMRSVVPPSKSEQQYMPSIISPRSKPEQSPKKSLLLGATPTTSSNFNPELTPSMKTKSKLETYKPLPNNVQDSGLDLSKKRKCEEPILISDSDDDKEVVLLGFDDSEEVVDTFQTRFGANQTSNLSKYLSEEIALNKDLKNKDNDENDDSDNNDSEDLLLDNKRYAFTERSINRQDDYINKLKDIVRNMVNLYPKKNSNPIHFQRSIILDEFKPQQTPKSTPVQSDRKLTFDNGESSGHKDKKIKLTPENFTSEVFIPLVDPIPIQNSNNFVAPKSTEKVFKSQLARDLATRPKKFVGVSSVSNTPSPVGTGKESLGSLGLFAKPFPSKSSSTPSVGTASKNMFGLKGGSPVAESSGSFAKSKMDNELSGLGNPINISSSSSDSTKKQTSIPEDPSQSANIGTPRPNDKVASSKASMAPSQQSRAVELEPSKTRSKKKIGSRKPSIDPSELIDDLPGLTEVCKDNHKDIYISQKDLNDKRAGAIFPEEEELLFHTTEKDNVLFTANAREVLICLILDCTY
jgi:hypothetical protein